MIRMIRWAAAVMAVGLALPMAVHATPTSYDLSFQTSGQSIWGSGSSFTLDQTKFIGAQWQNKTATVGAIVGDQNTDIPNPARAAYDVAFAACTGLGFSSSACINGQSAVTPLPRLGSRPSVRSCGKFAFACKAARLVDLSRRAAYDVAFNACRALGNSSSACRNGRSGQLPVVALGTAPPSTLSLDTRTGAEATATTDGRVGLELGLQVDSGSVDATVSYQANLDIPDTAGLTDRTLNFNANSQLAGTNTLNTSFANFGLSVDAVMDVSGSVSAEACIVAAGCTSGNSPFSINETVPVVSFNQDGEGGIQLLGHSPSDFGLPAELNGFPATFDVAGLANVTLHLPQPNASGGLDTNTNTLKATGQDDLVDLLVDVDNVVATAAGVPGLFGQSADFGPISLGYDIINVEMGPTVDLKQNFELDPTLLVELAFDQPVEVNGQQVTSLVSPWDTLPDITFLSDVTTVTPTFFLNATLDNQTLLDFDLQFLIDLLQVNFQVGLLGIDESFGIGNVLDQAINLFESPNLFQNLFALGGFNLQQGDSFIIDFNSGSTGPASTLAASAINRVILGANPVPEPATIFLLFAGLCVLFALRRRDGGDGFALLIGRMRRPTPGA